ncbi:hypothetical protein FRB95_006080 [Tulasnella sp. JGI-2019a]|nr:hypothetical protein FRB95_006080 [Tulasnella sp. JGI-2019a]
MYIYNKYYFYALVDLVDTTLAKVHARIVKKEWDGAFFQLEALAVLNEIEGSWPGFIHGDHIEATDKLLGASLVTVLRALKKQNRLDEINFPSLGAILRLASSFGGDQPDRRQLWDTVSCRAERH